MKKINLLLSAIVMVAILFTSCKKDEDDIVVTESTLPSNFKVDIPSSISNATANKNDKSTGGEIYGHLRTFIFVGESAAEVVQDIMRAISVHNLSQAMEISFESDDDGRTKKLIVIENSNFEGKNYDFQLTMTDALAESNADGGVAMQIFWNKSSVIGLTILKPYNLNRTENPEENEILYRIDYSEIGNHYDQEMTVYISGLPIPADVSSGDDKFTMETLKMFAGRKGDIVDVFGNSNHPKAWLFNEENVGFNWAFAASSDRAQNIASAEVGLPSSSLNSTSRTVLLEENSIHNIFETEIRALYPNIAQADLDVHLADTNGAAFFHEGGFITAGTSPGTSYDEISTSMSNLVPFNPSEVSIMKIEFKSEVE